ncbi:MAG: asparagine synthase (glutamine-hydrolyzing) [Candidatus Heimdallarchaeota archaeon]|nr:MAG: asparagine synthase (glutamine-hydrolyzing) [Candidatus Heimdallarchaeota archaeon]
MCGILAIVINNPSKTEAWLKRSSQLVKLMAHRGPDAEKIELYKNVILGHRRLSIIDLSNAGIQPMVSDDGRFTLILNGEIYNYIELREELRKLGETFRSETDTEVLMKAYKHYGLDFFSKINGMFSFIIWDNQKEELLVARDRFGIKPLYYSFIDGDLIISSEIKPIIAVKENIKPDFATIYDFVLYTSLDHSNRTFFDDIYRFPSGHYSIITKKNNKNPLQFNRYWDLVEEIKKHRSDSEFKSKKFKEHKESVKQLFHDALKLRLRSDVRVGSCLSGGIDSSSIVSMIHEIIDGETKENFETFSMVYGDWFELSERKFIDEVGDLTNFKQNFVTPNIKKLNDSINHFLESQEEPVSSISPIGQYYVMELAKNKGTIVLLDGQGADEILGGYLYLRGYFLFDLFRRFRWVKLLKEFWIMRKSRITMKYFFAQFAPKFLIKIMRRNEYLKYFKKIFLKQNKQKIAPGILNVRKPFHIMSSNLIKIKLPHLLKWEDRSSMAFSIETRVPFLDHNFVSYILSLPSEYIIKRGITKWIFRESMRGITPESILSREDKIGFAVPEQKWVNDEKFELINEFKKNQHKYLLEIVDFSKLEPLFKARDKKKLSSKDAKFLYILANLNRWFEIFFKE